MKIKVNDNVQVLAGEDKGKTGKVIKTLAKVNKVVVEGVNISKRHTKPRTNQDQGGIFEIEMPIHVSNVRLVKEEKKVSAKAKEKKVEEVEVKTTKKSTKKASK